MKKDRGTIKKIIMHIEYPDGTTREAEFGEEWLSGTGAILMNEACMTEDQKELYKDRGDWKKNPTFLRWESDERRGCPYPGPCTECCSCSASVCQGR